jgi:hypothetical protein
LTDPHDEILLRDLYRSTVFVLVTSILAPIAVEILFAKKDCSGKRETAPKKLNL